jgi:hypothetical protein
MPRSIARIALDDETELTKQGQIAADAAVDAPDDTAVDAVDEIDDKIAG